MDFSLSVADTAIIIGSVLFVVLVGLLATRRQDKTARGYFLASGKLRWWIIGAAFVSTSVSSEQIVGTVGAAYKNGMGIANWEWWALPCYTLLIVFFIPIYLRNRIATVPELLTRRYGQLCGDIYSWTMLLAYVFIFMVPILYGGSLALLGTDRWNFYMVLWATIP
jgi:SSS family solute:Na+ symporter